MECVKKPWLDFEELLGCHWPSGDCGDRHRSLACPAAELAVACDGAAAVIGDEKRVEGAVGDTGGDAMGDDE